MLLEFPEAHSSLPDLEAVERTSAVRERLGHDLLILGHHYQRDEVIRFADEARAPRPPGRRARAGRGTRAARARAEAPQLEWGLYGREFDGARDGDRLA